jgi:UDP-arabinose 4-epimerase
VLDAAAGIRPVITVFGDDYDTPDGTCIRDYIHVSDLADAHVLALQALENGASTTSYNLGNGKGFSVREVIEVAEKVTGLKIPIVISDRRVGDPANLVGDAALIKSTLGWKPEFTELEDILKTAWAWHDKQRI